MRVRLSFDQDPDGRFVLLAEDRGASSLLKDGPVTVKSFDHEDLFLKLLMEADLDFGAIAAIAGAVLKRISDPTFPARSVEVDLTREQYATLGLADGHSPTTREGGENGKGEPFGFAESGAQFHHLLMHAPMPFVILSGPEHRFTFINPPYVRLMGRSSHAEVLGKPVRKVLPELEGQPFFDLLDRVYATGVPYVGVEIHAYMRNRGTAMEDRYFDFIYHPVRKGGTGIVSGILVLASDVTERVMARQTSEERKEKLYQQWAELEAIYRTAPIGLAVFEVREFRVLRMNQRQAGWMGSTVEELVGKRVDELPEDFRGRQEMFEEVAAGESIRNEVLERAGKRWMVNMNPLLGVGGEVEAVNSITLALN